MLLGWVFLTVAGLALVRGKAATCASEESLNVRLRGFTVQHTITPAWISCLPSKSIHISCRISALTLGFFSPGLGCKHLVVRCFASRDVEGKCKGWYSIHRLSISDPISTLISHSFPLLSIFSAVSSAQPIYHSYICFASYRKILKSLVS